MRPQRKPFVVELKKSRRSRSKIPLLQEDRDRLIVQKDAARVGLALQREDRR